MLSDAAEQLSVEFSILRRGASSVHGVGWSRGRSIHGVATGVLSDEEAEDPHYSPGARGRASRWKETARRLCVHGCRLVARSTW